MVYKIMVDSNAQNLFWKGKDNAWVFYKACDTFQKAQEEANKLESSKHDNCETMLVNEEDKVIVMCRRKDGQV